MWPENILLCPKVHIEEQKELSNYWLIKYFILLHYESRVPER